MAREEKGIMENIKEMKTMVKSEKEAVQKKKERLQKEKEKILQKEFGEIKDTLQRVQAEFENSRKRMEKEKQEFSKHANSALVKELLPLLDSVDAAREKLDDQREVRKDEAVEGIELIQKQLLAILKVHGLQEIECKGKKFDPMKGDCVMQAKVKGKGDGIVLEELQKGYTLNGKVLRHAKVKVNKI